MSVDLPKQIGRYVVLGQLGRGARSVILQVRDPRNSKIYTLKHVLRQSPEDDRFIQQAENEYAISGQVTHQYLRKSLELKKIRKWLKVTEMYLLMEYFESRTLKQQRPSDIGDIIDVFVKVAQGLEALHQMGYIHADIKPKNILVNNNGQLKIIDFGQSCPIGHRKERVQGTPDYMAPEQVSRGILDQRTDIFNVGASLYWSLTGQNYPTTMPKPTGTEISLTHTKNPPAPPEELNPQIPTALSKLVMDCCSLRPADRPDSMREFIARLEVSRHILDRRNGSEGAKSHPKKLEELEESGEFDAFEDIFDDSEDTSSTDGDSQSWLEI